MARVESFGTLLGEISDMRVKEKSAEAIVVMKSL
jgi:hypothetical protein